MRLTLRTLLAYLDGNLEPDDVEDIRKKIEESELATKLMHTIREATQRPRLGSPALMGRGLGADPNTVAEYLEYRLADERVPEFERICMGSEVHLAEVASCHQILTLVLGEPAEIDPQARERMYGLAAQASAPPVQADAIVQPVAAPVAAQADAPPAAPVAPPVVRRPKPEVPDYLRESRVRIWPIVAMVLVAATLTFAGLFFFGPAPFRQQITALVSPDAQSEAPPPTADSAAPQQHADASADGSAAASPAAPGAEENPAAPGTAPAGTTPAETPPAAGTPEPTDPYAEPAAAATPEQPADAVEPGIAPAETPAEEPPAEVMPADAAADPALVAPAGRLPGAEDPSSPPAPQPSPLDATSRSATPSGIARPLAPIPGPGGLPGEMPAEDASGETLPEVAAPLGEAPADAGVPNSAPGAVPGGETGRPATAEGFGRFTSLRGEVLLKFDPASGDWMRLPDRSPLNKGDRLLSLPLSQPYLTLSSNITLQADGPTEFELVGWDDAGVPIIALSYGRLLMDTVGRAGNSLRLQIDGLEPMLTFVDPESTLAVEAHRVLPPGKDPQAGPAPLEANVYATSGLIRIAKQTAAPVELQAPAMLSLTSADDEPQGGNFPTWVTRQEQSEADRAAAGQLIANLSTDAPVSLQLRELSDRDHKLSRRHEVRTLAIRSLTYLNKFEPSIAALNESDLRNYWVEIRRELQAAIARSPETASRVRAAFVKQRGEADGLALDRMLWGYNNNDLQSGSDRDLIDALGRNDALDFRVLGFLALKEIKGGASHGYQPEASEAKRNIAYNAWKRFQGKLTVKPGTATPKSRPATP